MPNTGIHCERFAFKIQYKPLSKKMLEEPFWLGLICVGSVLALLSIVYCIKKKFAERIEAFFAEEIEKSKSSCEYSRPPDDIHMAPDLGQRDSFSGGTPF
jgi:hypothetical protein